MHKHKFINAHHLAPLNIKYKHKFINAHHLGPLNLKCKHKYMNLYFLAPKNTQRRWRCFMFTVQVMLLLMLMLMLMLMLKMIHVSLFRWCCVPRMRVLQGGAQRWIQIHLCIYTNTNTNVKPGFVIGKSTGTGVDSNFSQIKLCFPKTKKLSTCFFFNLEGEIAPEKAAAQSSRHPVAPFLQLVFKFSEIQKIQNKYKRNTNTNTSSSTASTTCFSEMQKNTKHLLLSVFATTIPWISQIWSFIYRSLSRWQLSPSSSPFLGCRSHKIQLSPAGTSSSKSGFLSGLKKYLQVSGIEWECSPEFEADVETAISFLTQVSGVSLGWLVGWDFSSNWCFSQPGLFRLFSQLDLERRWVCHQLAWKLIFFSIVDDFFSTVCFTEVFVDDFVHFVFHRGVCWWFCALCVSHCWVQRTTGALSWKLLLSWGHFWSFSFHFIHFTSELCTRLWNTLHNQTNNHFWPLRTFFVCSLNNRQNNRFYFHISVWFYNPESSFFLK